MSQPILKFLDRIINSHHLCSFLPRKNYQNRRLRNNVKPPSKRLDGGAGRGSLPFNVSQEAIGASTRRRHHRLLVPLTWLLILSSESVRKIRGGQRRRQQLICTAAVTPRPSIVPLPNVAAQDEPYILFIPE